MVQKPASLQPCPDTNEEATSIVATITKYFDMIMLYRSGMEGTTLALEMKEEAGAPGITFRVIDFR